MQDIHRVKLRQDGRNMLYQVDSNKAKEMVKKKKRIWKDGGNETNEDFEGGLKQMWVGMKEILGEQAGEADTGITSSSVHSAKWLVVRRGKGKYRKLGTPTAN